MKKKEIAVITGCGSGIGFRTALKFARKGFGTYASVRNINSQGSTILKKIAKDEDLPLYIIEIDVSKDESVDKGIKYIKDKEKKINILINNAGVGYLGPIEDYSISEVIDQYQVNIFGMLRMVKAVVPIMRIQKSGRIINLSSINGLIPFPMMGIYSSSKYAVETLTEILRLELFRFNIKVTQIEPGLFLTKDYSARGIIRAKQSYSKDSPYHLFTENSFRKSELALERLKENKFLRRIFDAQKVADKIYSVSQEENPRMRYRIGIDAHLYYFMKKILPERIWEWLMHTLYKW